MKLNPMTAREKAWLAALVILSVLALVELFYIAGRNQWLEALNNAGHLPVFGLLAIAVLHLVKVAFPGWRQKPALAYGWAFAVAAMLGAASELVQYFSPRDADAVDLLRDLVGAASFLALYAAVRDRDLKAQRSHRPRLKSGLLLVTGLLWLAGGWSLLMWSAAYGYRWVRFPVICDFDSYLSTRFLEANGVELDGGAASDAAGFETRGTRMRFVARDWPGVEVFEVSPDWTDHDSLVLELTLEEDSSLLLGLSVHDRTHNQQLDDRFTQGFRVDPGRQRLAVALGHVIQGPKHRQINIAEIRGVRIFSDSTSVGRAVLLEQLFLK